MKRGAVWLVGPLLVGVLTGCGSVADSSGQPSVESDESRGVAAPPWEAPPDVAERVAAAGLDLGPMGMAEHYHPHLRVIIDGTDVGVPPNIGVDLATGAMSALHTHEADGTVHVEASTVGETFTLGQVFTQWGVDLTLTRIGGMEGMVTVTSNGERVMGDPNDLRLEPDQKIDVRLRTSG